MPGIFFVLFLRIFAKMADNDATEVCLEWGGRVWSYRLLFVVEVWYLIAIFLFIFIYFFFYFLFSVRLIFIFDLP